MSVDSNGGGRRRAVKKRGGRRAGCLVVLVVLGLLAALAWVGLTKGVEWARDQFGDPEDYAGPGSGAVVIQVNSGDSATVIARTLKEADVVASVDAFRNIANSRADEAAKIQPGSYEMLKKMKAVDAFNLLVDPANASVNRVTVPEGLRVVDVLTLLGKKTDFNTKQYRRALSRLELPSYAELNAEGLPEGYLFPATYDLHPDDTPQTILQAMVDRWKRSADKLGLVDGAKKLGYTPHEVMTIASLVEAEGRGDDMPKIARVIYNRLENPGTAGTIGRLEIDATVNYALGRNLGVAISPSDLDVDSPYNTRRVTGLPPGPIEAPGDDAMAAALAPAAGDWYYYVTVDLRTGETKFASNYDEFLSYKAEFTRYCQTSDAC
ncbi:endolytic transglycosylase MltG [Nocardioides sp. Bht2]|uniref:endolytic transglycosylase MltG n=1 Tax=Nocardioides sp. Bht2 TaxID=3392297 RepID=UPI0039B412AE